ncbi:MAG: hypothetical protein P8N28_06020, partial [Phycisphaerales bacterium]|nr:hypothetical protein [Phycisphaerales bacterium]
PSGHARNTSCDLEDILQAKFAMHGKIAMDNPEDLIRTCSSVGELSVDGVQNIWNIEIADRPIYKD